MTISDYMLQEEQGMGNRPFISLYITLYILVKINGLVSSKLPKVEYQ